MYDTAPSKKGRRTHLDAVFQYIQAEYAAYNGKPLPDRNAWVLVPCRKRNTIVPMQDASLNNCGLFTCLIMELLINKIDPWILNDHQSEVDTRGRFALFHSIKFNKPVFQHCYGPANLSIERCKNGPHDWEGLFPLTSVLVDRAKCPYIEELAYHLSGLTVKDQAPVIEDQGPPVVAAPSKLSEPWNFKFVPPELNDGVVWSYDHARRIVLGKFTNVTDIHWRHKRYIGEIMERDDLTLIMEGLVANLCAKMEGLKLLLKELRLDFGNEVYHNYRRFDRVTDDEGFVTYRTTNSGVTPLKVKDYVRYLTTWMGESPSSPFSYKDENGLEVKFDSATDVVFYMLDVDMTEYLTKINSSFETEFKMKEILPGGAWCMVNSVSCTNGSCC